MKPLRVISLGWGTQSFTLAAMVALGEMEPVDYAIHADTKRERSTTYAFAKKWTPWLEQHGVKVVTVCSAPDGVIDDWGGLFIPAYTIGEGVKGQLRRQCTQRWKIVPMRRFLQQVRKGKKIDQLLGITLDEVTRVSPSGVKYIQNIYPFIDLKMSRWDCIRWLQAHGLEVPTKSACYFCPYHSRNEWREIKKTDPRDWKKALQTDKKVRRARPPYDLFLTDQRKPLDLADFDNQVDKGQLSLWENECAGICGV
jgi:hypothetical protein